MPGQTVSVVRADRITFDDKGRRIVYGGNVVVDMMASGTATSVDASGWPYLALRRNVGKLSADRYAVYFGGSRLDLVGNARVHVSAALIKSANNIEIEFKDAEIWRIEVPRNVDVQGTNFRIVAEGCVYESSNQVFSFNGQATRFDGLSNVLSKYSTGFRMGLREIQGGHDGQPPPSR